MGTSLSILNLLMERGKRKWNDHEVHFADMSLATIQV